jgi:uncharacterized membrane protein YraQ (UPF0718 family)
MNAIIMYGLAITLLVISSIKDKKKTKGALKKGVNSFLNIFPQMLGILTSVGIIFSFFDADTISKIVGSESGWFGVLLSAVVGSITLIPVFILLGLLDAWVPKEMMMTHIGDKSGIKGILLALFLGSAAAGPLYGAFPVAAILMKKGAKFSNVLIFIGAWSTTKIPMLLFEMASLGKAFALTRLIVDIHGIIIIAMLIEKIMKKDEIEKIYEEAAKM